MQSTRGAIPLVHFAFYVAMGGNPFDGERRVLERLIAGHPLLHTAELEHFDVPGIDGVLVADGGKRVGLQLTEMFAEGTTNKGGSTARRVELEWSDIAPRLEVKLAKVTHLDRTSISLRFRMSGAHLDPFELPRKNEREAFVSQLSGFLESSVAKLDRTTLFGHDLLPQPNSLVGRYIQNIHVEWRRIEEDAPPLLRVVGLNQWLRMGPDVMNEVFQRKAPSLNSAEGDRIRCDYRLEELYLVIGGDSSGRRHTKQTADYPFLLHSLTYMSFLLDQVGVDGVILFHGDRGPVSVFCALCVRNHQTLHNWRARQLDLRPIRHRCARLKLRGPTRRPNTGELLSNVTVNDSDENEWSMKETHE
ncbi:MAG: hypothetical protein KY459_01520 [Acidobacteria bacterium]|nr:hypothetical protein [Acidobacteriota bacterium]